MEIRWLKAFEAVAQELNYGRAARVLHIAQPAVSQQIVQLEKSLGVTLFDRTTRSVRLTPAGHAFRQPCRAALEALSTASRAARNAGSGESGSVRVGFSGAFVHEGLSRLARLSRQQHPGIELVIAASGNNDSVLDQLLSDKIDIGFMSDTHPHPKVATRLIGASKLGALVPSDHRLAGSGPVPLADLADEPFVLTDTASRFALRDVTIQACLEAGFQPRVAQEAADSFTVFALVSAGMGLTLVPESAREIWSHGSVYVPLTGIDLRLRSVIAWAAERGFPALDMVLAVAEDIFPTPA
jgi:DNA-binding transcriptional LysR family regulator